MHLFSWHLQMSTPLNWALIEQSCSKCSFWKPYLLNYNIYTSIENHENFIFELADIEIKIPEQELSQLCKNWAQKAPFAKMVASGPDCSFLDHYTKHRMINRFPVDYQSSISAYYGNCSKQQAYNGAMIVIHKPIGQPVLCVIRHSTVYCNIGLCPL